MSANELFGVMGDSVCGGQRDGLFLDCYCPRMVLAVKQEGSKINLLTLLDGCGPFANACSWEEEKAFLDRPLSPLIANAVPPIPPTVSAPLLPSPQVGLESVKLFPCEPLVAQ